MSAIHDEMRLLADQIIEAAVSTIGGLRAKASVALWEAWPITAEHDGDFDFSSGGGASRSLCYAVAAVIVRELEARLAADATVSDDLQHGEA